MFCFVILGFFVTSVALPAWMMLVYWLLIQFVSGRSAKGVGPVNVTPLHDASWMVVCSLAELLPGTGSCTSEMIDALLASVPETLLVTVMVTVAVP